MKRNRLQSICYNYFSVYRVNMKKISEFDNQGCYSYSKIWAVTIPILLSMLMEHIIGLTDTAFLGRVSEVALGASALGSVYCLAFFVLGFGFSFGAQILIARRNGEKNFSKIGQIWYASLFFLILLALGLIVAIRYFSPQMLSLMVKSSNICDATVQYLDYRAYGLLFAFIMAIFRAFYVGIAQTKILTYSSIVMVLSNIILNYALIFGKFGLPEMGIAGAALASSIAEGIAMLYYIGYTLKAIDLKKYGFYSFSAFFKLNILKKVFTVSFWMMLQPFLSISVWFFFFLAVEHLGERSLAVVNLARTLSSVPFLVTHACATTASSLVSNLIGEGKINLTFRLVRKITISGICTVTPMLLFIAIFPELVLKIYTNNSELIADSINVIYVMCVASFIQIPAFILFNVVSGTGAVKMTVFIESVTLAIYTFFVYLIIIRMQSTPAISWTVEIIYQATSIFLCLLYLKFGNWRQKRI